MSLHRGAPRLPLVLLPAMLCDEQLYRAQVADLTDRVRPMVFPFAEASLGEAAQSVLARAPSRFALAGTSAGGNLALEIVARAPARIAGLWLMGCNPGPSADPDGARRLSERVRAGEFAAVVEELAARAVYAKGPRAAEATETFRGMARRAGPAVFLRQNDALITRHDRRPALERLAVPTLLLWGQQDQFASVEHAAALAARAPACRLVLVDDCGHLPTLEQPEACTRAAREWLAGLRTRAAAG